MTNYIHKVQYYETDRMGITHHSNYIRWMEEARLEFMEEIGIGYDKMESLGVTSPVIKVTCDYKNTTTFPDKIAISLRVKSYNGIKLVLAYEMRNEKSRVIAATGESQHCFLNGNGRPIALQKQLPDFDKTLRGLLENRVLSEDIK